MHLQEGQFHTILRESQTYPLYIVFLAASLTTGVCMKLLKNRYDIHESESAGEKRDGSTERINLDKIHRVLDWRQKDCITFRFPRSSCAPTFVL